MVILLGPFHLEIFYDKILLSTIKAQDGSGELILVHKHNLPSSFSQCSRLVFKLSAVSAASGTSSKKKIIKMLLCFCMVFGASRVAVYIQFFDSSATFQKYCLLVRAVPWSRLMPKLCIQRCQHTSRVAQNGWLHCCCICNHSDPPCSYPKTTLLPFLITQAGLSVISSPSIHFHTLYYRCAQPMGGCLYIQMHALP